MRCKRRIVYETDIRLAKLSPVKLVAQQLLDDNHASVWQYVIARWQQVRKRDQTMECLELRFAKLESDLAHQQHLCDQLNSIVAEQNKTLLHLERLVPKLQKEMLELREELKASVKPTDERPPHY
jgi:uncharacterized coiled-coil protein SlyX